MKKLNAFLLRRVRDEDAHAMIEMEREEAALYTWHQEYFSYGFYVPHKR